MAARARFLTRDGAHRWMDARVTARFGPDGSIDLAFHVLRDIHEQKVAEDRARDALLRTHAALDASPDGFALYRASRDDLGRVDALRLEFLNTAAISRLPGSAADLIGASILDLYPQAAANGLWSDMLTTLATGEQRSLRLHDTLNGHARVTDAVVGRLDQDTLVVTYRDSTEQARHHQELAQARADLSQAQQTLQSALDAIDYGFVICDAVRGPAGEVVDLQICMANRAAATMRGTTVEEFLGSMMRRSTDLGEPREAWDKAVACLNDQQPRRFREEHGTFGDPGWSVREVTVTPLSQERITLAGRDVTDDEHIRRVADLLRSHPQRDAADGPTTHAPPIPDRDTGTPDLSVVMPSARHAPGTELGPTCGPDDLARCRALAHHAAPARDLTGHPVCRRTHPIDAATIDPLVARIDAVADQVRGWTPDAWDLLSQVAHDSGERLEARRFARECAHYAGRDAILSYARTRHRPDRPRRHHQHHGLTCAARRPRRAPRRSHLRPARRPDGPDPAIRGLRNGGRARGARILTPTGGSRDLPDGGAFARCRSHGLRRRRGRPGPACAALRTGSRTPHDARARRTSPGPTPPAGRGS